MRETNAKCAIMQPMIPMRYDIEEKEYANIGGSPQSEIPELFPLLDSCFLCFHPLHGVG